MGHSYGGYVITGVADKLSGRIRNLVYLDSALPDPGQSLIEILNLIFSKKQHQVALPQPNPPYMDFTVSPGKYHAAQQNIHLMHEE